MTKLKDLTDAQKDKLEIWLGGHAKTRLNSTFTLYQQHNEFPIHIAGYNNEIQITHALFVAKQLFLPHQVINKREQNLAYPIEVSFRYKGIRFFSVYTEEEFEYEDA